MSYCWFLLFFLATVPLSNLAANLASRLGDMRVKHSWDGPPGNWVHHSLPANSTTIDLRISLKPHRENALIDTLYEISSPDHPKYGEYLSQEQVADLVAPHPETFELVKSWLESHGVPSSSFSVLPSGNWLKVSKVPVSQANELLGASYQHYRHTETNDTTLRTIRYAVPEVLQDLVQTVAPTTYFHSPRMRRETQPSVAAVAGELRGRVVTRQDGPYNDSVTPLFLRTLYNSLNYVPSATDRNVLGIAGYLGLYPRKDDIPIFMKAYRPDAVDAQFSVVQINGGGYSTGEPSTEGDTNMEYSLAMSYPTPHIFYSTGGQPPVTPDSITPANNNEPYLNWLEYVLSQPSIPQTITSGYSDDEQSVPVDYAKTVCLLFAQLGARGVSLLVDSGYGSVGGGSCEANDGSGKVRFQPMFPSTCPYVTSVGGTMYAGPEVAANGSSGGFSNYFERPSFQSSVVPAYLQILGSEYDGLYNSSGRGYPDVASQFYNLSIVQNGYFIFEHGPTATTFGAIISLLNDFLLSQNLPVLGFLNPWLYGQGQAGLNDITYGSNPGCNTEGFLAVPGWDAVTGLGTPNFVELQGKLPYR